MTPRKEFCEYRTSYDLNGGKVRFGSWIHYYTRLHSQVIAGNAALVLTPFIETTWYEQSQPTYFVHAGMAVALGHTKIEVPVEQFCLPFEAMVLRFEPRTVFVDPSLVTEHSRGRLCGPPFVRAMMVAECPAPMAELEIRAWSSASSIRSAPAVRGRRLVSVTLDLSDDDPRSIHEGQILFPLMSGATLGQCVRSRLRYPTSSEDSTASDEDCRRLAAIASGVVFLAISKDRRYVERTRIKPRPTDECICGSGQKHKRCCGTKGPRQGERVGFEVGRTIDLPYRSSSSRGVTTGDGRELEYGHMRSGHMRSQRKKNEAGEWVWESIFLLPTRVRPDLPLKPLLTPRQVRERAGRMDTPSTGETS